ncbi:protein of unknown function [Chryseobacterium soldanellicola]|uniref:DUF4349 domain-containing protein n=1 Tax=Chryseobacterium soldanellicola TaxID=311333 RepID=A0A1H0XWI2_9FLAO|nr:DUF4349 domain-containing protein [Chryseobacterium soldanellicola]SDQ07264.1 protein of unknown function [Chryseobacterium soldanellicola]
MKKFILLFAVTSTFIMCKKGEATQSQIEKAVNSADSSATAAMDAVHTAHDAANQVFDSANVKIREFDDTKENIKEKIESTSKSIDSLSDKIAATKLESKIEKKDSADKKPEKIVVNVPAPKVIKETKIIYKNRPKSENSELITTKNKMVKSGFISINVDNIETVKEIVKEEIQKNNGFIKSEELSYIVNEPVKNTPSSYSENDRKVYEMQVKVPIRNFDDLMNGLSSLGEIENKNIEVFGNNYAENAICNVSITVTDKAASEKEPKTFGEKSLAAISSGWGVITSIFLFILPLWPLILIGGIGYYFYKKRSKSRSDKDSHQI